MTSHPIIFLDIDTQRDFLLASGAAPCVGGEDFIPVVQKLVGYGFTHQVPVVSSMDAHTPADTRFGALGPHCIKGTQGQLKVEGTTLGNAVIVANRTDEWPAEDRLVVARQVIIEKQSHNIFDNPHTEYVFEVLSPRVIIAFGVDANHCLRTAVRGLAGRDYRILLVLDAVCGVDSQTPESLIRDYRRAGARLIRTSDIISLADPAQLAL